MGKNKVLYGYVYKDSYGHKFMCTAENLVDAVSEANQDALRGTTDAIIYKFVGKPLGQFEVVTTKRVVKKKAAGRRRSKS